MISGGANSFGQPVALQYINFKSHLLSLVIVECDEKAAHIEQALHLGINAIEQRIRLKRRAQRPSYFIQNVELFAAPRCLLNQITILHRHPNLVALEISSFKCGHDAPIYGVIEGIIEQSGTPYFCFKDLDENKPSGSIRIRVETIDYFLRRYREEVIRKRKAEQDIEAQLAAFEADLRGGMPDAQMPQAEREPQEMAAD